MKEEYGVALGQVALEEAWRLNEDGWAGAVKTGRYWRQWWQGNRGGKSQQQSDQPEWIQLREELE